jgi:hypothetical protein
LSQPEALQPGYALLSIVEAPAVDTASLMFSIEQPPRGFLQAYGSDPWGTTHAWLRPFDVRADPENLALTLGPDQTWNLKPNVTYILRIKANGQDPLAMRIAWKGIRMPSQAPPRLPDLPAHAVVQEPIVEIAAPGETVAVQTAPVTGGVTKPDTVPPPPKRSWLYIVIAVVLLLTAAGAAAAWVLLHHTRQTPKPSDQTVPVPAPNGPIDVPSARLFLQKNPSGADAYAEAQRYLKAGSPDGLQGALVLLNHAAGAGDAPAETAIGRMYDPDGFSAQASAFKAPDADKALLHYQHAAAANDPDGLYRLGKLLMSGRVSAPGLGPEQGVVDLQRASDLGYKPAQEELEKLHAGTH